jgi:hypothetical protein
MAGPERKKRARKSAAASDVVPPEQADAPDAKHKSIKRRTAAASPAKPRTTVRKTSGRRGDFPGEPTMSNDATSAAGTVPDGPPVVLPADTLRQISELCGALAAAMAKLSQAASAAPPGQEPGPTPPPAPAPPSPAAPPAPPTAAESLPEFLAKVDDLTTAQRKQVADVALSLLEELYVHLPLKKAMHAIDPIQRLKILRLRLDNVSARNRLDGNSALPFHNEMISIFHSLRDLHTTYGLPSSYQGRLAYLPFLIEMYHDVTDLTGPFKNGDPNKPGFVVSRILAKFDHPDFKVGVNVTHWNGIPIERAVGVIADREAGSNDDARIARGLEAMTIRPLSLTAPPDEQWVVVGYQAGDRSLEHRFDWSVFVPPQSPTGIAPSTLGRRELPLGLDERTELVRRAKKTLFFPNKMQTEQAMATPAAGAIRAAQAAVAREASPIFPEPDASRNLPPVATTIGVDIQTEQVRRAKKSLFFPDKMRNEREMHIRRSTVGPAAIGPAPALDPNKVSYMPDVFEFWRVPAPQGELGYLRIYTFMLEDADEFVTEFVRIVTEVLPPNGLIIDVRGNGGGNILAGERLLQTLTPRAIEPELFHFINTATTLALCSSPPEWLNDVKQWADSIRLSVETGETYSQGFTLESTADANKLGQQYQGPVLLVTDALCYSTTDIFAAGFQDHEIGTIVGTSQHTGAGGANVWEYSMVSSALPGQFPVLPKGVKFRVAARRTTRVGTRAGLPVEDLGVKPDHIHYMTRDDVLRGNADLFTHAAQLLAAKPVRSLSAHVTGAGTPGALVDVTASNVTRVDLYIEGRHAGSVDVVNGSARVTPPNGIPPGGRLELRGFDGTSLVVSTRLQA